MNCRYCGEPMSEHPVMELLWCINPRCYGYDRPMYQRERLGGYPEEAELPTALPIAPIESGR